MENRVANKIIMLEDLVDRLNGRMVIQIVKFRDLDITFKKRPDVCPHCHSKEIIGIEVMGANEGVLLWECDECNCVYLRKDLEITEHELQEAKVYWTNKEDWGHCPKSQYN